MSKPNGRRVRISQYRQQVAEAVLPPDGTVAVELDDEGQDVITFRVPLNLDEDDEYLAAIRATKTPKDISVLVLGEEQRARYLAAGGTDDEFATLFAQETSAAKERMRDFRYTPSGR